MSNRSRRSHAQRDPVPDETDDGGTGSGAWAESVAGPGATHHRHPGSHATREQQQGQIHRQDEFRTGGGRFSGFEGSSTLLGDDAAGDEEPISYQEVPGGPPGVIGSAVSGSQASPLAQGQQRPGQQQMGPQAVVQQQQALLQRQLELDRSTSGSLVAGTESPPNYPGQAAQLHRTTTNTTPTPRHHQPLQQLPGRHPRHRQNHPPYVLVTPPADIVAPPYPPQQQHQHFHYQQHLSGVETSSIGDDSASPPPPQSQSQPGALLCHPHDPRLLQPHHQQHQQQHAQPPAGYFPPDAVAAADLHHPQLDHDQTAQLVTASSSSQRSFFPTPLDHPDQTSVAAAASLAPPAENSAVPAYNDAEQIQQFYQQLPNNWPVYQRPDGLWSPLMHPELSSILNAESYDDGTPTFRAPRSLPPRPPTITAADAPATTNPLKRPQDQIADAAVEWTEEPIKKRARGRPKLTNNGEQAVDRRRAQIRNAQRAYRLRKEEAIVTLEKRVQELTGHNEKMSNAFMEFQDFIIGEGLLHTHPDMARQLRATTEKFLALARGTEDGDSQQQQQQQQSIAAAEGADSEGNSGSPGSNSGRQAAISGSPGPSTKQHEKVLMAGLIVTHEPDPDYPPASAAPHSGNWSQGGPSYSAGSSGQQPPAPCEVISQPTVQNASFPFGMSLETALETNSFSIDTAFINPGYATPPNAFPSPPPPNLDSYMPPPLPPPSTLSYQERTFGRRLQRAALEQGLRLLSMEEIPTHFFAGVFGFCLLFESRARILERLTDCLSVNQHETLSNWRFPFLHLGGAGTFFGEEFNEMDDNVLSQSVQGAVIDDGTPAAHNDAAAPRQPPPRHTPRGPIGNRGLPEPHRSKVAPDSLYGQGPWGPAVESVKDLRVDRKLRIVMPGWEGDFFDCDEIEWYLQQRGIVIPPAADIIVAEIDDDAFMTGDKPGPTKAFDATIDNVIADWLTRDYVKDGPAAAVAAHMATPSATTSTDTRSHGTPMGEPDLARAEAQFATRQTEIPGQQNMATPAPGKRLITLNVEVLVNELCARSVCLGRTPGVRQKDVDAAFWSSVTLI